MTGEPLNVRALIEAVRERAAGSADPLVLLEAAVTAAAEAGEAAEALLEHYVGARQGGREHRVVGDGEADEAERRARRLAARRGQSQVRTEHLLFVLAIDPGSAARRVLNHLGVDPARVKKELAEWLPSPAPASGSAASASSSAPTSSVPASPADPPRPSAALHGTEDSGGGNEQDRRGDGEVGEGAADAVEAGAAVGEFEVADRSDRCRAAATAALARRVTFGAAAAGAESNPDPGYRNDRHRAVPYGFAVDR